MRFALLADVHGNLEALEAVLSDVDARAPDAVLVCAGDVVGYGADPGPCLELLLARGASLVMGNHEQMVLGLRGFEQCIPAGITAALWTRKQLSPAHERVLRALPGMLVLSHGVVVCHGDLVDAGRYVSNEERASAALRQLDLYDGAARVLVCGHTHHAMFFSRAARLARATPGLVLAVREGEPCIVNPGSVGQPRDGSEDARYALLDMHARSVSFEAVPYDRETALDKMRRAGLQIAEFGARRGLVARQLDRVRCEWAKLGARWA